MLERKSLKELNLLDRFLFDEAMADPQTMRDVLEIILGKEIVLKHLPQAEKEERTSPIYRGIRLDVWSMDEEDTIYDVEAQLKNTHNLAKRSRYYQSVIDSRLFETGVVNFNELNDVYIILIAPFDLFGEKRYLYTFDMSCRENREITLDDGAVRVFLNTHGKNDGEVNPELVELLHYMENTTFQIAQKCTSDRIHRMHRRIEMIRKNEEVSVRYMQAWEEKVMEREEGREEGRKEGLEKGRREGEQEGRSKVNNLIKYLIDSDRADEVKRVVTDPEYQDQLLKEYESLLS